MSKSADLYDLCREPGGPVAPSTDMKILLQSEPLDLIEWMIVEEPKKRPTVEECLSHPFFWATERRAEYLRRTGNRKKVVKYRQADQELISSLENYAGEASKEWKTKIPELVKKMDPQDKAYTDNTLGLLCFMRNLQEHLPSDEPNVDLMATFPDLFGCVYKFAKVRGWNSETPLKEMFWREDFPVPSFKQSEKESRTVPTVTCLNVFHETSLLL